MSRYIVRCPPSPEPFTWGTVIVPGLNHQAINDQFVQLICACLSRPNHFAPQVRAAWEALAIGIASR